MTRIYFKPLRITTRGFGLVELLVSVGIMVLVTTIVLARHSAFNDTILLRSQAYELALSLREVQVAAVSVSGNSEFDQRYGMRLEAGNTGGVRYTTFAVAATTGNWTRSLQVVGAPGVIDDRFQVTCIQRVPNVDCEIGAHYIVFNRPNFDALFFNDTGNVLDVSGLRITIGPRGQVGRTADGERERSIVITRANQISVQ